jgi:hypothetical protein
VRLPLIRLSRAPSCREEEQLQGRLSRPFSLRLGLVGCRPWSRYSAPTGSRSCCCSTRSWSGCWSEPHFARLSSVAERRNPLLHGRLNRRGGCRISPIPTRPPYRLRELAPRGSLRAGLFWKAGQQACRKPAREAPRRCRAPRPGRASARRCNMAWGPPSVEVAMLSTLLGGGL